MISNIAPWKLCPTCTYFTTKHGLSRCIYRYILNLIFLINNYAMLIILGLNSSSGGREMGKRVIILARREDGLFKKGNYFKYLHQ